MDPFPSIEPHQQGMLDVGDGHQIYWEVCGNPAGQPALVLHGGPGSGCTTWSRRLFDPTAFRVILFDQRGCGRSTPNASTSDSGLANNTTADLVADIDRLSEHQDIDQWLLVGGSWGSTLGLAYAEAYPERITGIVLFGVTTGRHSEFDWTFRGGLSQFFPEQWDRLLSEIPAPSRRDDVVEAYGDLLFHPDPEVCAKAAEAWCLWESATPAWPPTTGLADRFQDAAFRLGFARIVTHYVRHNAWLEDGILLRDANRLADIPGVLINGRFDLQAPITNAWELKRVWPKAELVIVDDASHTPNEGLTQALMSAIDGFANKLKQ